VWLGQCEIATTTTKAMYPITTTRNTQAMSVSGLVQQDLRDPP
jgi:hypothetical protein